MGMRGDFKGSKNGRAKLDESQVMEIKHLLKDSDLTMVEIAKRYNVSKQIISRINNNKIWKHVII